MQNTSNTNTGDEDKASIESKLTGDIITHTHNTLYLPLNANLVTLTGTTSIDASYKGKIIEANGTFTITLPDGMDTGMQVEIVNTGSGVITIAASTLQSKDGAVTIANQYECANVYHRGSNIWLLTGNLT